MVLFLASSSGASSSSVHPLTPTTSFPITFIFFWITTLFVALSGTTYHALAFSFYNDRTNTKNTNNNNNRLFFFSTTNNAATATATAVMTPSLSVQYKQNKQHNTICMAKKENKDEDEEDEEEQVFLFEEDDMEGTFAKLPESDIPVAFIDPSVLHSNKATAAAAAQDGDPETKFIECYIDAVATLTSLSKEGKQKQKTEYYIGTPCDYSVTLCYFDEATGALQPVEDIRDEDANNQLMDEIFPIAASIVEEEFGDELGLVRTPQTLTLVGELELDDDDDDDDQADFDPSSSQGDDDEEEVEILLTFDHDGVEYNLVRLLDPVLLVAKSIIGEGEGKADNRKILLTEEESEEIMPYIEEMILDYQEEDWNSFM